MAWNIVVIAGLFEVGWAIGMKYTEGLTRLWPTVGTVLAMVISVWLLGVAMKSLPVDTAYSVWVGVGAVGTVVLGIACSGSRQTLPGSSALRSSSPALSDSSSQRRPSNLEFDVT